jgi:hypothetical protein
MVQLLSNSLYDITAVCTDNDGERVGSSNGGGNKCIVVVKWRTCMGKATYLR